MMLKILSSLAHNTYGWSILVCVGVMSWCDHGLGRNLTGFIHQSKELQVPHVRIIDPVLSLTSYTTQSGRAYTLRGSVTFRMVRGNDSERTFRCNFNKITLPVSDEVHQFPACPLVPEAGYTGLAIRGLVQMTTRGQCKQNVLVTVIQLLPTAWLTPPIEFGGSKTVLEEQCSN